MTKTFSLMFFLFFLISCNKNPEDACNKTDATTATEEIAACSTTPTTPIDPTTGTDPIPPADEPSDPAVPALAYSWDTNVYMVNFNAAQEEKVNKAIVLIKKVIASKEFKERVLNYTYNGSKSFIDNGGFTNEQIYQKILESSETMNGNKNNIMDVELELYYQSTSTIGYTYPDTVRIWMNTKYFDNYTPAEVADNLTHEWTHKLGFAHASKYSVARDHSVPYAIGYLVEELAAKYK